MLISGLLAATGGAAIGYWGLERFRNQRKLIALGDALLTDSLAWPALAAPLYPHPITALLKGADDRYQLVIHNTVDRLFGEHYEKHLQALGGTTGIDAIPPEVKMRNRQAGYAAVSLALFLTGAPLAMAGATAINLYLGAVMIQVGLKDMGQKRKFTARGRDIFVYIGVLASGYLPVQSAALMLGLLIEKLIATVQAQSHERLTNVFGTLPQTVWLLKDGVTVSCPLAQVAAGDIVVVHAGEIIPVDGEVLSGHAEVDQHALTGEAQPVEKETADRVFASTFVLMGEIKVRVEQANADTLAAQITTILNNTHSHQTQIALSGVKLADDLALPTVGAGMLVWPIWGVSSMLAVASAPIGSMLMATTPLTLMAYLDLSARRNILIKDGRSLELLSRIDTVIFDKTGTLTLTQPTVCGVHRCAEWTASDLLALAAAMEQHQSHPVAAAIRAAATEEKLVLPHVAETSVAVGYGLAVIYQNQHVRLGSQRYMQLSDVLIPTALQQLADTQQARGHSIVYLAIDGLLQGAIELQPTIRPEAETVVKALHQQGRELIMITGDQEAPAQALAATLGIDRVFANVLPEQKADLVRDLQTQGRHVMFVGDGINDSIAFKQAHVSVSIAGATTVALDTAQIVLMDGTLQHLNTLFDISQQYERDMKRQYALAIYTPLAYIAGVFTLGLGLVSSYLVGYTVFLSAIGLAFRPIWRQERLATKPHLLVTVTEPIVTDHTRDDAQSLHTLGNDHHNRQHNGRAG